MTKKIILLSVAVFLVVFVGFNPLALGPEASYTSMAVQVPEAINLAIATALAALLALGAAYLFEASGIDLRGFATPISIVISAWTVAELQNLVNMVPEVYDPTLDFVLKVVVLLLGSVGLLRFRKPALPIDAAGHTGLLS